VPWGPDQRRAAVTVSFDNLGEVSDIARGRWPEDEPLGRHFSVVRALPAIRALLDELGLRATFFVEGRNTELYPGTLTDLAADGHEVAYHGWCHEQWADLDPARERELLERGRRAMEGLGLALRGFRPPGGRLTGASLRLLRELGFTHCSPAGTGVGRRDGVAILPFRWPLLDAFYVLPRFGPLRGSADPRPPEDLAAALDRALDDAVRRGGHLSVVFHPFLLDDPAPFAVLRAHLEAVLAADAWCAPYAEIAASGPLPADDLRLDLTPA
jgi:peptidoglycan/xylan/chitin deacetylase (PgdA/CDA1 family)